MNSCKGQWDLELSTFVGGGQWNGGREERSLRAPKEIRRKKLVQRWPGYGQLRNQTRTRKEPRNRTGTKEEVKTERGKQAKQDVGNPTTGRKGESTRREEAGAKGTEKSRMNQEGNEQGRREGARKRKFGLGKKPLPTRGN